LFAFIVRCWHGSAIGYDADGLLVSAENLALTRDAQNGRLTGSTLNTVNDSWNYTGFGEAQSYVAAGSTALYAMSFTRDHAGRISTKTETLGGVTSVYSYTYDAARGWLTDVSSNGLHTAHYDYDDNGNRTDALTLDREVSYATADGQDRITGGTLTQPLQTAQNVIWSYTANGEVAGRTVGAATTLYSYDVRGNLRDVTLTNGVRIEYLVDATGRRLGRKVGGTLTRGWLYQDGLKPVAELDGAGNVVSRFVYGGKANVPEYVVKNGAEYRLITDQLGSVRLVVNAADGSIAQRLDYDEFGRVLNDSNPGFQPFGYAGGLYDPDTGLVRFGARDYDADAGRWMSKDPIGFDGGDNWYDYVDNDPINKIDPTGLIGCAALKNTINHVETIIHSALSSMSSIKFGDNSLLITAAIGEAAEAITAVGFLGYDMLAENAAVDLTGRDVVVSATGKIAKRGHGQSTYYRTVARSVQKHQNLDIASGFETATLEGGKEMVNKTGESWSALANINPALGVYNAENEMGNNTSESIYETIKGLQSQLSSMINTFNSECCK
jgi:RHS repeat-associated protein